VLGVEDETDSPGTKFAVQFIHQTVKDFVAGNRNDLGFHLDPTFTSQSGYLYLLKSGVFFGKTWARVLNKSIFEYAFLAELEGSTDGTQLFEAFRPMLAAYDIFFLKGFAGGTFRGWTDQECLIPEFTLIHISHTTLFLALTVAADLKTLSNYLLEEGYLDQGHVAHATILTMAAAGRRLSTTSASREPMIKLLLKYGIYQNGLCNSPDPEDAQAPPSRFDRGVRRTPLAWVLRCDPQKHISKEERYSIARLLLEHGADTNALAVPDACCGDKTSLLYSCIQHCDVEAVRLLLLHETDTSVIDHPLIFRLRMRNKRRATIMLDLLQDHHCQTIWDRETMHPAALLVMESGCAAGIGSPLISSEVGYSYLGFVHRPRPLSETGGSPSRPGSVNLVMTT
jgi:hypothetical protein